MRRGSGDLPSEVKLREMRGLFTGVSFSYGRGRGYRLRVDLITTRYGEVLERPDPREFHCVGYDGWNLLTATVVSAAGRVGSLQPVRWRGPGRRIDSSFA